MKVELKASNGTEYESVKLYNSFTFDERLDEELDGGFAETLLSTDEEMREFTEAIVTLDDGETQKVVPFFLFDDVEKRANGYYRHALELLEPTRWLMGITIDGLKVTQPIDESKTKKTLLDVTNRVLRCFNTFRYSEIHSGVGSNKPKFPLFYIDSETQALLNGVISPEFEWQAQTLLFEVLQDIADVVDAIPRLTTESENAMDFICIHFDKINDIAGEYEF